MTDEDTTETAEETRSDREDGGPTGTGSTQGDLEGGEVGQEGHGHGDRSSEFDPHE